MADGDEWSYPIADLPHGPERVVPAQFRNYLVREQMRAEGKTPVAGLILGECTHTGDGTENDVFDGVLQTPGYSRGEFYKLELGRGGGRLTSEVMRRPTFGALLLDGLLAMPAPRGVRGY